MSLSPDKKTTLVFSSSTNRLDVIGNKDEIQAGLLQLTDKTESFFYLPDNKTVYVAVRNSGQVIKWDTSAGTTVGISNVFNVRWIVRSNNGNIILAFPDDNSNTVYFIDTTATTPIAVAVTGFDRPVWAVFSSDDSKAYVMNCGPECGSASLNASVQILNLPAHTLGASATVPGATHGLLDGNTLYVAGTPPTTACSSVPTTDCSSVPSSPAR
jgi:DNA-binding beta-propeller fold protein YncE